MAYCGTLYFAHLGHGLLATALQRAPDSLIAAADSVDTERLCLEFAADRVDASILCLIVAADGAETEMRCLVAAAEGAEQTHPP